MKTSVVTFFVLTIFLASCEETLLPVVETISYEIVSMESVLLTGEVTNESGGAVTKRGFCWGTNSEPTVNDYSSENDYGPGTFTQEIHVTYDQKYFFRSYAIDANGTQFGKVLCFKTELKPVFRTMTDRRDWKSYRTVKINNQTWMAENLAFLPSVSRQDQGSSDSPYYYVYNYEGSNVADAKSTENYDTYGVLYNWRAAMIACPSGWHLPSDEEWTILTDYLGSSAGVFLKEPGTTHWENPNTGANNASGFKALPGGMRTYRWGFVADGTYALFWSASEGDEPFAWCLCLGYSYDHVAHGYDYSDAGFSVRCLKNENQ